MARFIAIPGRLKWLSIAALILLGVSIAIFAARPQPAAANSGYMSAAQAQYPTIKGTQIDSCNLCHLGSPPARNPYGDAYRNAGHNFGAIESLDSDGDGYSNIAEINAHTFPGDASSKPGAAATPTATKTSSPGTTPVATSTSAPPPATPLPGSAVYKIIGWNDLGMHCTNQSFANMALLPPYNNLYAEVIRQGPDPQRITTGIVVEYSIEDNTYSVGKSNFWNNAQKLFHLAQPLAANIGLTGAGLSGRMTAQPGGFFKVEGIPLTPFRDSAPTTLYPYQIAHLTVKDAATGKILAETRPVAPTSTEMHCEACHSDGQREGISTGNVETNILTFHDRQNGTNLMGSRPVLCADCHASNALGKAGNPELPNLSRAMHSKHEEAFPQPNTMDNTCYQCHPGTATKCLRDTMGAQGMTCINCHGDLAAVANTSRRPWLDEPKCGNCHGSNYAENTGKLYRESTGHGGLFCETCHGSPHAILPSQEANDNIQNISLQGHAGTLSDCKVCHGVVPTGAGPHGIVGNPGSPTPAATARPSATATPTRRVTATPTRPTATPTRRSGEGTNLGNRRFAPFVSGEAQGR